MSDQTISVDKPSALNGPDSAPPVTGQPRPAQTAKGPKIGAPVDAMVNSRLRRGDAVIRRSETRWRELWAHFDGDQFVEQSATDANALVRVETREGAAKPRWRSRLVRNRYTKSILGAVSVICSRVPAWEVVPINGDKERTNKARLAEKVLFALHEPLNIRQVTFRTGLIAGVTGDGYAFPHWDPTIGPPILDAQGNWTGKCQGDLRIKVLRQDQVMWQPNQAFEESRWYAIRDAQPVEDVIARAAAEGLANAAEVIKADASTAAIDLRDGDGKSDLVFVYHYFERPTPETPKGRYWCIANNRIIGQVYDYPIDRDLPCIHRFPWIDRPNRDRGLGIGELIIDIQRSITRIVNQIIAWRNLVLVPQILAPENSLKTVATEEPGIVLEYRPTLGQKPEWREVKEAPVTLFKDLEQAYADMDFAAGGTEALPIGVESGQGVAAVNEREASFRAHIIANLSKWYSGLGRHLLCLVKQHYSEERLLVINGRFGVDMIPDFMGSQLDDDYAAIRVSEASITPRTRAEMEAKIVMFADKGWITPQQAMSYLQGGTADAVLDRFELDIAKAHRHISALIKIGNGELDPELVPMAGPQDDHQVQADIIGEWMKTSDYERQHPIVQTLAMALFQQHQAFLMKAQMDAQNVVNTQAIQQGQQNATKPAGPSPDPSRPSLSSDAAALGGQAA